MRRPLTCLALILVAAIILLSPFSKPKFFTSKEELVCEGYISSPVRGSNTPGIFKFNVKLYGCFENGAFTANPVKAQVSVPSKEPPELAYGDVVRFKSKFNAPKNYNNPGAFDFIRYCQYKDIDTLAYVKEADWIKKIGVTNAHPFLLFIENIRSKIGRSLDSIPDIETREVGRALLIGDGSYIPEETNEAFRLSGLIHLLVISGLHVGFVAIFVFFILKWLLLRSYKLAVRFNVARIAAFFSIAAVWFYVFLTGAAVSVTRAGVIATAYFLAILLERRPDLFSALSLSALVILIAQPMALYDPSFLLSFGAVLSLAIFYPVIAPCPPCSSGGRNAVTKQSPDASRGIAAPLKWLAMTRKYILQTICASISAMLGVAPILAYYFGKTSLIGIAANVLAVPWTGFVVTPVSFVQMIFRAGWSAEIFAVTVMPLIWFAKLCARYSEPFIINITPTILAIVSYYALLFLLFFFRKRRFFVPATVFLIAVAVASIAYQRDFFNFGKVSVTFLDVGQGSSSVLRFPDGKVTVIDGGGIQGSEFDLGEFVIAPFLRHKGISKIDTIILTHPHPDHYKGLSYLVQNYRPTRFVYNGVDPEDDESGEWRGFLEKITPFARLEPAKRGDKIGLAEVLSPPEHIPSHWNDNDKSLVLKYSFNDNEFIFAGDIEAAAEEFMSKSLRAERSNPPTTHVGLPRPLRDLPPLLHGGHGAMTQVVLLVPHHGSKTSSSADFLNAVKPDIAVIQAGRGNRFGFPSPEVLQRLQAIGAKILRTDQLGAIELK